MASRQAAADQPLQEAAPKQGASRRRGRRAGPPAGGDGTALADKDGLDGAADGGRYRPLPTGTHGLDPETVRRDQTERLERALVELIAKKGYGAIRIVDLTRLAHVSRPTFYRLFPDKEQLLVSAYDRIVRETAARIAGAYEAGGRSEDRLLAAVRAFAVLAAEDPESISLLVLGAFGAGTGALERRRRALRTLEARILAARGSDEVDPHDLTVKAILGGIREVTAARLSSGRARELPSLAPELTAWLGSYPRRLPAELSAPAVTWSAGRAPRIPPASERARRAEGRLPSGRSELPRPYVRKSQQERIVDAIAAIVCEKGLGALTIPEIARRANVSLETFYELYPSKDDAFLGTQKVGMHQALQVGVRAWEAAMPDWPRAIAAGMRAVVDYLVSEPAHAHLSIIDTFGASPETIEVRASIMQAFTTYFAPGYELQPAGARPPAVSAEAVVGAIWQMLHHYIDCEEIEQLPAATPQLTYLALTPFIGPERAAAVATEPR